VASQNTGWQTVLRRNPNYRGPRPHPLDGIVYDVGTNTGPAAARVIRGTLDYESESYPDFGVLAPNGAIAGRYASARRTSGRPWYTTITGPEMDWLEMNTTSGLFTDLAARRAVDLAVDRPALAALSGGVPEDQYLPPSLMGTAAPSLSPPTPAAVARARDLLHNRNATVTLQVGQQSLYRQAAVIIRDDLAKIGLRVRIDAVPDQYSVAARAGVDMRLYGWVFDFFDPSNLLSPSLFSQDPYLNPFGFSSPHWAKLDAQASRLSGPARLAAFARVARGVHRSEVPWVMLDRRAQPAFFSARLGCIHEPPAYWGIDIAALCVNG
jgi:ABC-type transport system substrate-binding protein